MMLRPEARIFSLVNILVPPTGQDGETTVLADFSGEKPQKEFSALAFKNYLRELREKEKILFRTRYPSLPW